MKARPDPQRYRINAGARGIIGAVLASQPSRIGTLVDPGNTTSTTVALTRILGTRHLAEAVLLMAYPKPIVRRVVTGVDGVHAVSMCALTIGSRRHRRTAAAAAVLAAGLMVIDRAHCVHHE